MLIIRFAGVLVAIGLSVCVLLWLATGKRKWLAYAWRLFMAAFFVLLLVLLMMFGERLLAL